MENSIETGHPRFSARGQQNYFRNFFVVDDSHKRSPQVSHEKIEHFGDKNIDNILSAESISVINFLIVGLVGFLNGRGCTIRTKFKNLRLFYSYGFIDGSKFKRVKSLFCY